MTSTEQRNRRDSYHPEKARHNRMGKVSSAFITCERENWTLSKNCGKLFWLVIILIGACLTVKMCIDVYNEYKEEPTTISVSYMYNDSLTFPIPPTLCLSIYNLHLNNLWYLQIYDEPDLTEEQSDAFDSFFDANMTKEKLIGEMESNAHWPILMIKTVDMHKMEYGLSSGIQTWSTVFLNRKLERLNVTLYELKPRLQQELDFIRDNEEFTVYAKAVDKFFAAPNWTRDSFLHRDNVSTWLPSWTFLSHVCLNLAAKMEFGPPITKVYYGSTKNQTQVEARNNACLLIERQLQHFDLTMDDLRQRFGWEMAKIHSLSFEFTSNDSHATSDIPADQWISIARTVHVSDNEVCYRLNIMKQYERSVAKMFTVIKASKPLIDRYPPAPEMLMTERRFAIAIDISGKERDLIGVNVQVFSPSDDNLYQAAVQKTLKTLQSETGNVGVTVFESLSFQVKTFNVRLLDEYRYLPKVRDLTRCVDGKTVHDYMRDCKLNMIEKELNCTLTSMVPLNEGHSNVECSLATLSQATFYEEDDTSFNKKVAGSKVHQVVSCVEACMSACEDWHMELLEMNDGYQVKGSKNLAGVYLPFNFLFPKYGVHEESFLITSSTLYGNLGGVLGLFLGIDLIVTVQFIIGPFVYFYASCVRLCGNSRTTAEPDLEGNAVSQYETNKMKKEMKQIKEQNQLFHQQLLKYENEIQANRNSIEQLKSKLISP